MNHEEQEFIRRALAGVEKAEKFQRIRQIAVTVLAFGAAGWLATKRRSSELNIECTVLIFVGLIAAICTCENHGSHQSEYEDVLQAIAELRQRQILRTKANRFSSNLLRHNISLRRSPPMTPMKKLILWAAALASFSGSALLAQSLPGTWQGSLALPNGKALRMVVKIETTDKDTLKGTLYSIDQTPQPIPTGPITLQAGTVKMPIPAIGGGYEGKLNADGKTIAGTFTQGGPLPLNLTRATPETEWSIPDAPAPVAPMKEEVKPAFEVATIKPGKPDVQGKGFTMRGREVLAINTTVGDLISFAYDLHAKQITGGPSWIETDRFDITGVPDSPGRPNVKQFKLMIQKLLADRFELTFHKEQKELSVYAAVVGKTGLKITKSDADPKGLPGVGMGAPGKLIARNATIKDFTDVMQGAVLDRPVVDQTGLNTERWDFTLNWTPDQSQFVGMGLKIAPPTDDPAAPPDLFTAFQQQLGLKLEAAKAPVPVVVIDKVAKPSEN
jgi:uncharacterized protein (TIGR03435 family)